MKQGQKYPIRQVSITNMTNFLNLLAGKTFRSKEIVALSKEHHIRANFLSYAKQISYCKKQPDGSYYFLDRLFDPIHGKLLIETSNKYNNEVNAKKKLLKEKTHFQESMIDERISADEIIKLGLEITPSKLGTIDETERVKEIFTVTQEQQDEIKDPLIDVLLEQDLALTPTQKLMMTVGSHINTKCFESIRLLQNKKLIENSEVIENSKKVIKDLNQQIDRLNDEINYCNQRNTNLIQQYEGELDFSQRQTRDLGEEKKQLQEENDSLKENIKHLKYIIYNAKEVDKSHEKNNEKSLLIKELLCQYLMDDCEVSTEINNKKQIENKTNFNPFDAPVIERAYTKGFYTDEQ